MTSTDRDRSRRSPFSRRIAIVSGAVGAAALAALQGARFAYGDFVPMHGYRPIHAHILATQEGLFLGLYAFLGGLAALGFGLCAAGLTRRSVVDGLARLSGRLGDRSVVICCALLAALASFLVAEMLLGGAFLTDDEMAMVFQARLLAEGRLSAEPPPFPSVFYYAMIIESPRWYGMYPIGHPALLALSSIVAGAPRALVPLVTAGWVALAFLLARRLFGRRTALLASALLVVSPFFVFSSGSLASQMTSGLFLLAAMNLALRLDGSRPSLTALGLGLSLGAAFIVRPYTALAVGLPLGLLVAGLWLKGKTSLWTPVLVVAAGLPFAMAYLAVNDALTGSPWVTPYQVNFPDLFIGFGQDAFGVEHSLGLALGAAGLVVVSLNAWALGWPLSLLPVGCAVALGRMEGRVLVVATIPLVVLVAHLPVPAGGIHDTGPLYYLEVLPIVVILAARGVLLAGARLAGAWNGRGRDVVAWLAIASASMGLVVFSGQQARVLADLARFNEEPYELADRTIEGRAVVFIEDIQTDPPSSWLAGNRPPSPDMNDRIVYANVPHEALALEIMRATSRRGYYLSRDRRNGSVSLVPVPSPAPSPAPD